MEKYFNIQSTNRISESTKKKTNMKSRKKVTTEKNKKSLEKCKCSGLNLKQKENKNLLEIKNTKTADKSLWNLIKTSCPLLIEKVHDGAMHVSVFLPLIFNNHLWESGRVTSLRINPDRSICRLLTKTIQSYCDVEMN